MDLKVKPIHLTKKYLNLTDIIINLDLITKKKMTRIQHWFLRAVLNQEIYEEQ